MHINKKAKYFCTVKIKQQLKVKYCLELKICLHFLTLRLFNTMQITPKNYAMPLFIIWIKAKILNSVQNIRKTRGKNKQWFKILIV